MDLDVSVIIPWMDVLCILMIMALSCITFPSISHVCSFSGIIFDTLRILMFPFPGVRLISHGGVPYS